MEIHEMITDCDHGKHKELRMSIPKHFDGTEFTKTDCLNYAAPDLLEACKRVLAYMESPHLNNQGDAGARGILKQAIAKAEGNNENN